MEYAEGVITIWLINASVITQKNSRSVANDEKFLAFLRKLPDNLINISFCFDLEFGSFLYQKLSDFIAD
jgi:hypothetical protein